MSASSDPPPPSRLDALDQRLRRAWPVAVLLLLGLVVVLAIRAGRNPEKGDTRFWKNGAQRFVDGENLYFWEPHTPGRYNPNTGYTYPPPFAVFSVWLLAMPYAAARVVWLLAMTGCLLASGWLSWRLIGHGRAPPRRAALLAVLLTALMARLAINDLAHGQSNWLITALLLFGLLRAEQGRGTSAGVALGLALAIKPTAWLLLPLFAARRRWRLLGACAVTLLVVLALPGLRYGAEYVEVCKDWFRLMSRFANESVANHRNASLSAALTRLASGSLTNDGLNVRPFLFSVHPHASAPWARAAAVALSAAGFLFVCLRRRSAATAPAAVLVLGALLSPVTWKAHLVVLVLPLAWLCLRWTEAPSRAGWILCASVFVLITAPSRGLLALESLEQWGTLTLVLVLVFLALVVPADPEPEG